MNNEELKKKIVEIINDGIIHGEDNFGVPTSKTIENIADVLIEAGIVDESDYASMKETAVRYKAEVSKVENSAKEAAHRAQVAERALRVFAENVSCADCPFFNGCDIVPDVRDDFSCCFDMYLAIAEKVLAEEGKNERGLHNYFARR